MRLLLLLLVLPLLAHAGQPPAHDPIPPGQRTTTITIATTTLAIGTYSFGPQTLPPTAFSFAAAIDRSTWQPYPEASMMLRLELSDDGGVTWPMFYEYGLRGGVVQTPSGPLLIAYVVFTWPPVVSRQVRGMVTVAGHALETRVEVTYVRP